MSTAAYHPGQPLTRAVYLFVLTLSDQVYIEACFREALRLHPAVGTVQRDVTCDTTLKGESPMSLLHAHRQLLWQSISGGCVQLQMRRSLLVQPDSPSSAEHSHSTRWFCMLLAVAADDIYLVVAAGPICQIVDPSTLNSVLWLSSNVLNPRISKLI